MESWEHIWERVGTRGKDGVESWQEAVGWVLEERGEGEKWMKDLEGVRKGREGREMRTHEGRGFGREEGSGVVGKRKMELKAERVRVNGW